MIANAHHPAFATDRETPADTAPPSAPPALSDREQDFLIALVVADFRLAEVVSSAEFTPPELLALMASPAVQLHIERISQFSAATLALRAIDARSAAIDLLQQAARKLEDPVEQRRAATALLRATASPVISTSGARPASRRSSPRRRATPPHAPSTTPSENPPPAAEIANPGKPSSAGPPGDRAPTQEPEPPTAPESQAQPDAQTRPDADDTPLSSSPAPAVTDIEVAGFIIAALACPRDLARDHLMSCLPDFFEHGSTINGRPFPFHSPDAAVAALERCSEDSLRAGGDFEYKLFELSNREGVETADVVIAQDNRTLTVILTRSQSPDSRRANCWLIRSFTTSEQSLPP